MPRPFSGFHPAAFPAAAGLWAAFWLGACAAAPPPAESAAGAGNPAARLDRSLAKAVYKAEWEKVFRLADSAAAEGEAAAEIALYWKAAAWLYREQPDSAIVLLESHKGRWRAGLRKVHGELLFKLARDAVAARAALAQHAGDGEASRPAADHALQERLEILQKENADLRAENQDLQSDNGKYRTLLKDLEKIR